MHVPLSFCATLYFKVTRYIYTINLTLIIIHSLAVYNSLSIRYSFLTKSFLVIRADFHRETVATAPGEKKLLMGRRPVRNWTQVHFFFVSLFFMQKNYTCS